MTWDTIAQLIAQYGLPLAFSIWEKARAGGVPTEADWAELTALANTTAKDRMLLALQRAGIDPASDQGKALLAATA